MSVPRLLFLVVSLCAMIAQAFADKQDSYVFCDNGLRCIAAPCPSSSALDLSDKLYAGKVVVAGSIENRTQTFNGKQYSLPTLVATGIERASRASERGHCSAR